MFAFHASAWYNRPHTNICTLEDVCGKACGQDVRDGDTVSGPTIIEIECKSMLNRVNVSWLPFDWSVNPYRGCFHGCVYCYARRYHEEYLEIDPGAGFDRQVFVKINAVEVLRRELAEKLAARAGRDRHRRRRVPARRRQIPGDATIFLKRSLTMRRRAR